MKEKEKKILTCKFDCIVGKKFRNYKIAETWKKQEKIPIRELEEIFEIVKFNRNLKGATETCKFDEIYIVRRESRLQNRREPRWNPNIPKSVRVKFSKIPMDLNRKNPYAQFFEITRREREIEKRSTLSPRPKEKTLNKRRKEKKRKNPDV